MKILFCRYELILTEKHHCLTLALMHHLFVGGMKNAGYRRQARLLFPGLSDLLQVFLVEIEPYFNYKLNSKCKSFVYRSTSTF